MQIEVDRAHAAVWRARLTPGEGSQTVIDRAGVARLSALLDDADASAGCRVLVLEGTEGSFCQGMDLGYLVAHPEDDVTKETHEFARCLDRLRSCRQLVVTAVDGSATGGGVGLAAAADIVLATARSTFALPEVVLGLLPAIVLPVLLERMPPQKARLLALSGSVDAAGALALGLVDKVIDEPERLERGLRGVIKQALRSAPDSVAGLKELSDRLRGLNRAAALRLGADRTAEVVAEPGRLAALKTFLDGERLPWFDSYRSSKQGGG